MVEYKAERSATRASLLVVVETSATTVGYLVRAERPVMRAGLLVGGFAGDVKIARTTGFSFPCSYYVSNFLGFRSILGFQIVCKISLHGEHARDVSMCDL